MNNVSEAEDEADDARGLLADAILAFSRLTESKNDALSDMAIEVWRVLSNLESSIALMMKDGAQSMTCIVCNLKPMGVKNGPK